jgi:UDPglucose 6-dehydrogenase
VAGLGRAFKGETDDMRESPAIPIVEGLIAAGAQVRAYDPAAMEQARPLLPAGVVYATDAYDAAEGADGAVIATEWNQFRALELDRLRGLLKRPLLVDLRNLYEPERVAAAGFRYVSVGRAEVGA